MRTVFFVPPLKQMSGGLANIYSVVRNLCALGGEVALMGPFNEAPGLSEALADIPGREPEILPWGTPLLSTDLWCIPESWPNAMTVGVHAGADVLVYVQNWVYMLGILPKGIQWSSLPLEYVAVSTPVAWFLQEVLALETRDILPPVVDEIFFRPSEQPSSHVRIAWMPRKNRALGEQAQHVANACLAEDSLAPRVEWVTIHKVSKEEVAALLSTCHLFLSTGFPEGFGLPPLEAMACGCVPVGCTGFGGWEYMRQARIGGLYSDCGPPFHHPSADFTLEGNGFFFADGDSLSTGMALARAACLAHEKGSAWQDLTASCRRTAEHYRLESQLKAIARIFP